VNGGEKGFLAKFVNNSIRGLGGISTPVLPKLQTQNVNKIKKTLLFGLSDIGEFNREGGSKKKGGDDSGLDMYARMYCIALMTRNSFTVSRSIGSFGAQLRGIAAHHFPCRPCNYFAAIYQFFESKQKKRVPLSRAVL